MPGPPARIAGPEAEFFLFQKDEVVKEALGEHILDNLHAKRQEWAEYISHVRPWPGEVDEDTERA